MSWWASVRPLVPAALVVLVAACGPGDGRSEGPSTRAQPVLPTFSGAWDARVVAPGAAGLVADVALRGDDGRIALAGQDGVVRVTGAGGGVTALAGHGARVLCVTWAPDGALLSGSADGTLRRWDAAAGAGEVLGGPGAPVVAIVSTSGGGAAALRADGNVDLLDAAGRRSGVLSGVDRVAALSGTDLLVTAARSPGELTLVDASGAIVRRIAGLGESAERFAVAPRGDLVVAGGVDGRVLVVAPGGVREAGRHGAAVQGIAWAPDGSCFATASLDGTAVVRDPDGAELLRLDGHGAPLHAVALLPDTARVLTVGADRRAVLWDREGVRRGTLEQVTAAAFVADGRAVLAWSGDGPARAATLDGGPLAPPVGTERGVVRVVGSPGGASFAWLAPDRTVRIACEGAAGPPAVPARKHPAEAYARPEWCARCHRPEYERWRRSSHAWTSALASPDSLPRDVLAGREVHHPPGVTRFGRDADGWFAETTGTVGDVERFRLTHVAGHRRMRMLLATLDDGRIQVLPGMTEWPDGPWFDYTHLLYGAPDTDPAVPPVVRPGEASFWSGSVRSWDQRCAVCHTSGRLPLEPGPDGTGPRSVWRSLGVDCETCHGPGRAHAEAWERGETGAPLRRLEDLPRDVAVAVCTQCHMEGDRVTPSYRIGDDLYEHLDPTLALSPDRADPYGRALELIYDGLPFGTSRCAEEGGLTCSRCHEPHGSAETSQLRFDPASAETCGGCHDDVADEGREHTLHDPRGSGGSCVACHMPFLTIERGHGAVADHTIGVPRLDQPGDRVATDACTWCHSGGRGAGRDAPRIGAEALRAAYDRWWPDVPPPRPWMRAAAAARTGDGTVGEDLLAVARDPEEPRVVRATAVRLLEGQGREHVPALLEFARESDSLLRRAALLALRPHRGEAVDAALRTALDDPSLAVRTNAARAVLAGWERARGNGELLRAAIPVLQEDVRSIPDDPYRWFLLGAAHGLVGDDASALAAYERMLALDPLAHAVRAHVERLRERLGRDG